MDRVRRLGLRLAAFSALVLVLVGLAAAPAFAHATLDQTSPAPGAVLDKAPREIVLSFSENVQVESGAIRLYDSDGARQRLGSAEKPNADQVRLAVRDGLKDGAYVVTWRVVSADSHPVQGAFTFQVGQAASVPGRDVTSLAGRLLAGSEGDRTVGALYGVARGGVFASIAVLIGGSGFCVLVWPAARGMRRAVRVVWAGWIGLVLFTIVSLLVYGPYIEGLGLGKAFSFDVLRDTLETSFGLTWAIRLGVLVMAALYLRVFFARRAGDGSPRPLPRGWLPAGGLLAVALALTTTLTGHARTGDWTAVAVPADVVHVLAMSTWLGGLLVLSVAVLPRRDVLELSDAVPRFSRAAFWCVAALVATGAFATWRQVGSLDALRSTDFGRILVVKFVVFAALVVFAAMSREVVTRVFGPSPPMVPERRVPVVAGGSDDDTMVGSQWEDGALGHWDDDDDEDFDEEREIRNLRRSVWCEVVLGLAIVSVTALLVNAAPARVAAAENGAGVASANLTSRKVAVDISVTPARKGINEVHIDVFTAVGAPTDVAELQVTVSQPDRKIAPIIVPLRHLGPGHYYSPGFQIPVDGDWKVVANVRLTDIDEVTMVGQLSIG